ncbi:hypothetical protein DM860_011113 [Cuscuta australis]|uniref:SWIM-type domain-containing protein n=1 Tax=Cuscuta australis TaxID=267555 RepID=A0A328D9U2_9ASTE|nr:hypothetical protein DM860_011113 [Cuscuta australis]
MDSHIKVLVRVDGTWDTLGNFSSKYDIIIDVRCETTLNSLMDTVKAHIPMDWSQNDVRFSYIVALCPPPIVILDDAELLFYLRLKSYQNDMSYLPLCMEVLPTDTVRDMSAQDISSYAPVPASNTCYTTHTLACTPNLTGQSNTNNMSSKTSNGDSDPSNSMKRTNRTKRRTPSAKPVDVISHYHPTTLQLDSIYKSKEDLCHHLQMYAVSNRFQYKTKRSNRSVLHIVCIDDRCSWAVRAVSLDKSPLFQIRRKASRAPTEVECEEYLQMLDEQDHRIRAYLNQIGQTKWARCKSGPFRYSVMTSNAAKSMNNVNNSAREYPICKLVDFIRERMQKWFHERFETATSTSTILPKKLESELITLQRDAFKMKVKPSCPYEFEIVDRWTRTFVVNLRDKSCTCGDFQLDHFVCVHAVAAIGSRPGLSCYNFISPYYKREALVATYSGRPRNYLQQLSFRQCDTALLYNHNIGIETNINKLFSKHPLPIAEIQPQPASSPKTTHPNRGNPTPTPFVNNSQSQNHNAKLP